MTDHAPLQVLRDLRIELVLLRRLEAERMLKSPRQEHQSVECGLERLQAQIEALDRATLDEEAIQERGHAAETATRQQSSNRLTRVQLLEKEQRERKSRLDDLSDETRALSSD